MTLRINDQMQLVNNWEYHDMQSKQNISRAQTPES